MRFLVCLLAVPLCDQPEKLTATGIEGFFDGLIPATIEHGNIAGAVVAVVKDGQVVFQNGYGYADIASKKPVTPDATLFRPGSISKLFVWTRVMQLVEQGKLDLDRDVNQYLDFKVPAGITLRHYHDAHLRFRRDDPQLFVLPEKQLETLRDYLVDHMPQQIVPPGNVPAYFRLCDFAGRVHRTAGFGEPFASYAANHILKPLAMDRTTFLQAPAGRLQAADVFRLCSGFEAR